MNILEIIVVALTVVLAGAGYRKGFVRKLASLLSLIISIALVSVCLPYVTEFLKDSTPVYDYIVKQCREVAEEQVANILSSDSGSGTELDAYRNMGREEIKELMRQEGYDSSVVDSLTDEQLESYRDEFIQRYAARHFSGTQTVTDQPDSSTQNELIRRLPLPQTFREKLLDNNNAEGYQKLGVSTFLDYIVHFCATMILNAVSFLVAFLLVQIVFRITVGALDILARIPVIGGLNRAAGLLLGLLEALLMLWIFFMAVSAVQTTEAGLYLMSMIQESRLLSYLYDSNFFMQIVLQTAAMFL